MNSLRGNSLHLDDRACYQECKQSPLHPAGRASPAARFSHWGRGSCKVFPASFKGGCVSGTSPVNSTLRIAFEEKAEEEPCSVFLQANVNALPFLSLLPALGNVFPGSVCHFILGGSPDHLTPQHTCFSVLFTFDAGIPGPYSPQALSHTPWFSVLFYLKDFQLSESWASFCPLDL